MRSIGLTLCLQRTTRFHVPPPANLFQNALTFSNSDRRLRWLRLLGLSGPSGLVEAGYKRVP